MSNIIVLVYYDNTPQKFVFTVYINFYFSMIRIPDITKKIFYFKYVILAFNRIYSMLGLKP